MLLMPSVVSNPEEETVWRRRLEILQTEWPDDFRFARVGTDVAPDTFVQQFVETALDLLLWT